MSDNDQDPEMGDQEENELLAESSSGASSSDSGSDNNDGPGEQNEATTETSSDEDEEMEDAEITAKLARLIEIKEQLLTNPASYDLQIEKIEVLRSLGDLDSLREAREKLNEGYPLSPELWLNWIQDESSLVTGEEDDPQAEAVIALFDRAVKDYLSADVWLEYANFCLGRVNFEGGLERCRQVLERALAAIGLHVTDGAAIWAIYRDFENALLDVSDTPEQMQEQENRLHNVCRRQLSVPSFGLSDAYEKISSKLEIDEPTQAAYQKAQEKLKAIQNFEENLSNTAEGTERAKIYKEYIHAEQKAKSNPARIICLYERVITEQPLVGEIWLDYIDYLSKNLQIKDVVLEAALRASRNCPWILEVWETYIGCAELFDGDMECLKGIFEKGLIYCTTGQEAGTLWLKYIECLRRRIDTNNAEEGGLELFKKTVAVAEDHLLRLVTEPNEYICEILLFRARVATHVAKNLESTKELWNDIFQRGYAKQFRVWLEYLLLEQKYGSPKSLRKHFERGLNSVDNTHVIVEMWRNYERDFGDAKSADTCVTKIKNWKLKVSENTEAEVQPRENEHKLKRKRSEQQQPDHFKQKRIRPGLGYSQPRSEDKVDGESKQSEFKTPFAPREAQQKGSSKSGSGRPEQNKRFGHATDKPDGKSDKETKFDPKNNDRTAFLSNLSYSVGEDEIREFLALCGTIEDVRLVKDPQGHSRGFAYVTFTSKDDVKLALGKDRGPLLGRPVFVSECDPERSSRPKPKAPIEVKENKLFVKGLPLTTTEDHLQALFGAFGKVADVRLITFRNGNSKGMAYVDFEEVKSATDAMEKTDGKEFEGHVLSVAVSNPPKRASRTEEPTASAFTRRTAKPFVPRSVQVKPKPTPESIPSNSEGPKVVAMNNQDFRQFFMNPPVKPDN